MTVQIVHARRPLARRNNIAGLTALGPDQFEGYASLFGVADGAGDIVAPGAFASTLRRRGLPHWRQPMLVEAPRLIKEWKRAWRWFSVQAMALTLALQGAWMTLPDDLKTHVPGWLVTAVSLALLALGLFGRLVQQK